MKQIPLIIAAVAIAQWLVFAMLSATSRAKFPKTGRRASETRLIISSSVLAAMWIAALALTVDWASRSRNERALRRRPRRHRAARAHRSAPA